MLVYANVIQLEGKNAFDVAVRSIHGWLSQQVGSNLPYDKLLEKGEWRGDGEGRRSAWLRSQAAAAQEPELHAWTLHHADEETRGRQWVVEVGLKRDRGVVDVSCTVQTDELSVLVTAPVTASRPNLFRYLLQNLSDDSEARLAPGVPGKKLKTVGPDQDDYRALLDVIEQTDRDYPIVLVSPDRDGQYLVNPQHLQEALLGLAQVVQVDTEFNSYEMEEVLGRHFSAWDGAVNFIRMPGRNGISRSTFFLSRDITAWGEKPAKRVAHILALVTHNTNVPRSRMRIRPDAVMALAMRRRLAAQGERLHSKNEADDGMAELLGQGLDELTEENEILKNQLDKAELDRMQLEDDKQELEKDLREERYKNSSLRKANNGFVDASPDRSLLIDFATRADDPTPKQCLEFIVQLHPQRVEVLETAYASARDRAQFQQGRRLLGLLNRLATQFVEAMEEGGDDMARRCFTNAEYSANESEGTQHNTEMRRKHTFEYNGEEITMWRHLKIGVADDQRKSIRVYFEWIAGERKVVIGHCGAHLPIISY